MAANGFKLKDVLMDARWILRCLPGESNSDGAKVFLVSKNFSPWRVGESQERKLKG
jgi:hypothetical protein